MDGNALRPGLPDAREGRRGSDRAAAVAEDLVPDFKSAQLSVDRLDCAVQNGDKYCVTFFCEILQIGIESGICKRGRFSGTLWIPTVIAAEIHALLPEETSQRKARLACSNKTNSHAVTLFRKIRCDASDDHFGI